jgi:hypothetical protein
MRGDLKALKMMKEKTIVESILSDERERTSFKLMKEGDLKIFKMMMGGF